MPNILQLTAENVDLLRNPGAYDTAALMRVQSSTTEAGTFADLSGTGSTPTITLVASTTGYIGYDPAGTSVTWYRTRYENAGATRLSDWSEPFQVGGSTATAICAYATLPAVKLLLGETTSTYDGLLQSMCDQVNDWIELQTGRPIGPWPAFATTVVSGFATGTNTGVLTSTSGLFVSEALMFGPVSGTHEHGVVSSISGSTVTLQANLVNSYAAAQPVKRVYLFDGYRSIRTGHALLLHDGIVSVASLEVATGNPAVYTQIAGTDFFLEPVPARRMGGQAATRITLTDYPAAGGSIYFYQGWGTGNGHGNVRIDGVPGLFGSIPDAVTGLAQRLVVEAFRQRGTGGSGPVSVSSSPQTFDASMGNSDWALLKLYVDQTPGF